MEREKRKMKSINKIWSSKLWWLFLLLIIIVINFLASNFHSRLDLTKEKRYTLSKATKQLLKNLNEPVMIDVFLKGDFPSGFKKLSFSASELLKEFKELILPSHHEVTSRDVNLKRLGAALWVAHEQQVQNFESLISLQGVGARTLQSLALVSEVIYGTPSRFKDPARFSFAHGGKDGHPFPVPTRVYDETIHILRTAIEKSKLGLTDKSEAVKKLHEVALKAENDLKLLNEIMMTDKSMKCASVSKEKKLVKKLKN